MRYKTRFTAFFCVMALLNLAANFAHPVTPTVIKNLNLHDYMFGVALAAMLFTNFLMSPFWGKINHYVSSRLSLMVCCCGYGIAQVCFAYSSTELEIILARMLAGLFTGGVFVSFLTYVVNRSAPEDQGKHLTMTATINSVASAFGYMVGGCLGEFSVLIVFLVQAATLVAAGILFFLICEPDGQVSLAEISPKQLVREANPFQAFVDSRKFMTASFALLFTINVLINFGNTGFDQAFNYYLKDVLGLTSFYNGVIKAGVGLISFISNMTLCVWMINQTNVKHSMVSLTAVCAVAAIGTVISGNIGIFIGFSVLVYAGYSVSIPVLQSMTANLADTEQKNLVMGCFNAAKSLGSIAGSMTAGLIYSVHVKLPFVCTFVIYSLGTAAAVAYACYKGSKKAVSI